MKLSALGLAVFLWALVQSEPSNQEILTEVPIQVVVTDTAWTASGLPDPTAVELQLAGPAREIIRLAREGTTLSIPVAAVGSADSVVELQREWVSLRQGSGLTVQSVSPGSVSLRFERTASRVVPVAMRLEGLVASNLSLAAEVVPNPPLIRVRGAASTIGRLDSVRLQAFDLASVEQSGVFPVAIDTIGLGGARVVPSSASLDVRVEAVVERVFPSMPIEVPREAGEADVVVDPVSVDMSLTGARTLVTAVDPTSLRVWIAPELIRGMTRGEARRVPIRIDGVPTFVTAVPSVDVVLVRRAVDVPGGTGGSSRHP